MITSLQNEQVKFLVSLGRRQARREYGRFLLEGRRLVREALARGAEIEKIFVCLEDAGTEPASLSQAAGLAVWPPEIPAEEVSAAVMRKICATETPQGVAALARTRVSSWEDVRPRSGEILLILDRLQDPGNLGTILRTALAAGVDKVCLTEGTVDLYSPKVVRATMGMFFSQNIVTEVTAAAALDFCREAGALLVVCDVNGQPLYDYTPPRSQPLALVIGNEGQGVTQTLAAAADLRLTVPMRGGVESLNAAMAAGLCLYELQRRRN